MDDFGRALVGMLLALFFGGVFTASLYRVRYWRDWNARWQQAHPAVAVFLAWELFARKLFRDRARPAHKWEAILWEAPALSFGAFGVIVGALLAVGVVG